jgi:hypothetical protein
MATLKYFKTFEKDSLAAGSTYSDSFDISTPLVIRRVYVVNKAGTVLSNSALYFKVSDRVYTSSVVPVAVLQPTANYSPELNIKCDAGEKVDFTFTNKETSAVSVYIVFECVEVS